MSHEKSGKYSSMRALRDNILTGWFAALLDYSVVVLNGEEPLMQSFLVNKCNLTVDVGPKICSKYLSELH